MQQKLLRKAGLLGVILAVSGVILTGCIDEPNPPVVEKVPCTVRFVHGVKDAPPVDIWVDGQVLLSNIAYKASSQYVADIKAGDRFIRLVPAGVSDTGQAVFRQKVSLRAFTKMTAVFYGPDAQSIRLLITQERYTYADELTPLGDSAAIKLINVNVSEERVRLAENSATGPTFVGPANAYSLTSYAKVPTGTYTFYLMTEGGNEMMQVNYSLQAKTRYSFIAVGDLATPELLTLVDAPN